METLRALIQGDLSPAGNKISLARQPQNFNYSIDGYSPVWVDSGTSALALALLDAKEKAGNVVDPKVVIPGYCCPDLVSAAVYAGVKPVVVDICVNDASYDLEALDLALADENTIAVIAVNFLGIKERLPEIKSLIAHKPIKIIEDNAQWFPASQDEHHFVGDYVLFSFGRGKPLSLLGGGVLFSKEPLAVKNVVLRDATTNLKRESLKIFLYNVLLNPQLYCFLNRAPFLKLGETRYHRHEKITEMSLLQKNIFNTNLLQYEQRKLEVEKNYDQLSELASLQNLNSMQAPRRKRLLRYPLLCKSSEQRIQILEELRSGGLGASPLYQRPIVEILMVRDLVEVRGDLKNSYEFARRFLTLPIHQYVKQSQISRIKAALALVNNLA
ncbi:MAG: DegT/DnrJ/EryC1/StrS aminotransferase family protein [Gammaproteobacteria bacterium]|nr:MAG: DegT/DnrJ/EryC1/StrS aminotransferase family protein [Gammaproteobacteria bacterium]